LNPGPGAVDISGWTLGDLHGVPRFQFPPATVVPVNGFVVLFGGGTPTGFPPGSMIFVDDGDIGTGLANSAENVFLINALGDTIAEVYWGTATPKSSVAEEIPGALYSPDQSYTRDPDGGVLWELHMVADYVNNSRFSPCATILGETTLPVELAYFRAEGEKSCINLLWTTESEINFSHFELYRGLSEQGPFSKLLSRISGAAGGFSTDTRNYSYKDLEVEKGVTYYYILKAVSLNGTKELYGPVSAKTKGQDEENPVVPGRDTYVLKQNYPNPFNPLTVIPFVLNKEGNVKLKIYDSVGSLVRVLADGVYPEGSHEVTWDGSNLEGQKVSSGLYFYELQMGDYSTFRKMVLLK
jgi:hypothetical protein